MPLEPSPHLKRAIESLACQITLSPVEAEKTLRGFLGEAEQVVTEQIDDGVSTPLSVLIAAVSQLRSMLVRTKMQAMTQVAAGPGAKGVDGAPLARLIAVIATASTMYLKDIAFSGDAFNIDRDCDTCDSRESCAKWKADNDG